MKILAEVEFADGHVFVRFIIQEKSAGVLSIPDKIWPDFQCALSAGFDMKFTEVT